MAAEKQEEVRNSQKDDISYFQRPFGFWSFFKFNLVYLAKIYNKFLLS